MGYGADRGLQRAASSSFVRSCAPSTAGCELRVRARRASARGRVLELCGGACQSLCAGGQREGAGAAREAIGGAPSAHVACCGWNHSDGLPAGSPRAVSGHGAIWRFEHACRSQRDRARSIVSRRCSTAFKSRYERVFYVFLISGEPGFVRRRQNRRER